MHMPGHKRNPLCTMPDPYSLDVTEVPGVDDLHHPVEMIRDLMDELTKYYDSKQTYLLVNGSTCGILAAITACCYPGDKILVARNCHKSVYNAIKLLGLRPVYVVPHRLEGMLGQLGIAGEIEVSEIRRRLKENPDIKCAMITSPTYEGMFRTLPASRRRYMRKIFHLLWMKRMGHILTGFRLFRKPRCDRGLTL